jgi:hypothetical protein
VSEKLPEKQSEKGKPKYYVFQAVSLSGRAIGVCRATHHTVAIEHFEAIIGDTLDKPFVVLKKEVFNG